MNKKFLLILLFFVILPFSGVSAEGIPAKLKGAIMIQVESRGQLWYVNPVTQERYYFNDATGLFKIVKAVGLGISNQDFDSLNKQRLAKLAGRILIKVEDSGRAFYITPNKLELIYLGRPNEIFKILASLSIGVANKIINPITVNKNFPETARVIGKNETSTPVPEPPTNDQTGSETNASTSTDTQTATTTPETPSTETATSSQTCQFLTQYFDNKGLFDPPATTTDTSQINYDWGKGGPAGVSVINKFSARWTDNCYLAAGTYRFTAVFDDAMSVYVDNENIIRSWTDNDRKRTFTVDREMTEGWHDIKVEYYEYYNNALAQFSWEKIN